MRAAARSGLRGLHRFGAAIRKFNAVYFVPVTYCCSKAMKTRAEPGRRHFHQAGQFNFAEVMQEQIGNHGVAGRGCGLPHTIQSVRFQGFRPPPQGIQSPGGFSVR